MIKLTNREISIVAGGCRCIPPPKDLPKNKLDTWCPCHQMMNGHKTPKTKRKTDETPVH